MSGRWYPRIRISFALVSQAFLAQPYVPRLAPFSPTKRTFPATGHSESYETNLDWSVNHQLGHKLVRKARTLADCLPPRLHEWVMHDRPVPVPRLPQNDHLHPGMKLLLVFYRTSAIHRPRSHVVHTPETIINNLHSSSKSERHLRRGGVVFWNPTSSTASFPGTIRRHLRARAIYPV